jgi:putative inorganic carbon (hco3(-)) transporter
MASFATTGIGQRRSLLTKLVPGVAVALVSFLAIYRFGIPMILGALLALGALWWISVRPDLATLITIFVMYTNAAAVAVRDHHVPSFVAMGFFLLLLVPVLNNVIIRREGIRTDKVLGLMGVYFSILVASAIVSRNPAESTETLRNYVFEGMLIYFLIINAVRTPEILRRALQVVLLAAVLMGALSSYQWLTGTSDNQYGGFAATAIVTSKGELERAQVDTEERGREVEKLRAFGPVADPNAYGQFMAAALPFALVPIFAAPSRRKRMIAVVASASILSAIILTYSRGAAVAVVMFAICMLFMRYFKLRHALLFAAIIAVVIASSPDYGDRIGTLSGLGSHQMREADGSVVGRALLLRAGTARFLQHPILGVGPGQSPDYIGTYDQASEFGLVREVPVHNLYLQQLLETGIVGFCCFMAIVFFAIRNLLRISRHWIGRQPEYAHIAAMLVLSIVAFLTAALFLHMAFVQLRYFSLILGLGGAACLVYRPELSVPSPAHALSGPRG